MKRWLLAGLLLVSLNAAADCRQTTGAMDDMAEAKLVLAGPGERSVRLTVLVADDHRKRAAGFQHICPETIERTAIYFEFERLRRPNFHMNNVKAALDIAFIDAGGVIADIQRMEPYVLGARHHQTYSPPGEVAAALEVRAGYFAEQGITEGDWRVESLDR
jgi:uncharacterized protein